MISMIYVLGSEVYKPLKILIKISNTMNTMNQIFKMLWHQEPMILSSSMYEKTYLHDSLEGFLKVEQVSSL